MFRRLFVSVLVAALTLAVAPRPSFGLDARDVRSRGDDHFRCMYRCKERGTQRPQPKARRDAPVRPLRHNCAWCGDMHGGSGPPNWGGRWSYFKGPVWIWTPGWSANRPWPHDDFWPGGGWRPNRFDDDRWRHRRRRDDRWHHWERRHDPSRDSGYDAHRHHPRSRDF